ncbi:MAG TPA: ATP-binding protein, partial [Labilithrix sp.]|nr:ATP-binding protein [Labilithrix sp.]
FGWTAGEVRGKPIESVLAVRGIDREKARSDVRAGSTMRLQGRVQHRDGHWLDIEVSSMPVKTAGVPAGFVSVMQDITERLRLEREANQRVAELQVANRELESFSYSVSHDLRAPVRAIAGFARLLYEDHAKSLDDEALRLLGVVRKNAQKMGVLIDDLLDFSRMGRQAITLEELDMDALVREILEEARRAEPDRAYDIRIGQLPSANADRVLIGQVWQNLLSNAIKYTRGRSPAIIEISGETTTDEVTYNVKDNGVGFDARFADKVFKVFERLHVSSEFEGTGVGLALVDRIVRRHGGRVSAKAKLGDGATFHFSLPKGTVPK